MLHDKLAKKAIEMGKHSSEFSEMAQKHANATWLYLMVAGAVWYFFSWEWGLMSLLLGVYTILQSISSTMIATRLENQEPSSEPSNTDFTQVVQDYGNILETSTPVPGTVADLKKLPYPKQQIKDSIIAALRNSDDQQMKEHLKFAYIQLSNWQEGVGESDQGLDLSSLDMSQDTESLAKAVLEQSSRTESWTDIVQKEQEALKQELLSMGLW